MTTWTIEADNYSFKIFKSVTDELIQYSVSPRRNFHCVIFLYYFDNPTTLILENLSYYPACALNTKLERGTGTIEMFKSALLFVLGDLNNDKLTHIEFADNSSFKCNNTIHLPLAEYSFMQYAKTWYARHLGATSSDPETNISNQRKINQTPTKRFSFADIQTEVFSDLSGDELRFIETLFNDSEHWTDFCLKLKEKYGCIFFAKYIKPLRLLIGIDASEFMKPYIISMNTVADYKKHIKKIIVGGSKKQTLKRMRVCQRRAPTISWVLGTDLTNY